MTFSGGRQNGSTSGGERGLPVDVIEAARGIGIVLVVFGHISPNGLPGINPYGFHMPLFFFLSGFTLRIEPRLPALLRRDVPSLVGYTLAHIGIFSLLTAFVFRPLGTAISATPPLNWKTYFVWSLTENAHNTQLFLIAWFLVALFFVRLIGVCVLKGLTRLPERLVTPAILVLAVLSIRAGVHGFAPWFAMSKWWLWNLLGQVSVGLGFALIGSALRLRRRWSLPSHPLRWALAIYGLLVVLQLSPMTMAWSEYPGGTMVVILHACLGICLVLLIALAVRGSDLIRRFGRDSKWIMAWHLTAFAVLNLAFAAIGLLEVGQIGVFTFAAVSRLWPLYVLVGVMLPLLLRQALLLRPRSKLRVPDAAK